MERIIFINSRNSKGQFTSEYVKSLWANPEYKERMRLQNSGSSNKSYTGAKKRYICIICNSEFFRYWSRYSTNEYCSRDCMYKCPKRRQKVSKSLTGKKLSESHIKSLRDSHLGKFVGEDSPTWKGGTSKIASHIRRSDKYNLWRKEVFQRDSFTCQRCFIVGKNIKAHHIIEFAKLVKDNNIKSYKDALFCDVLWEIDNGLTLCDSCHKKEHGWKTKEKL